MIEEEILFHSQFKLIKYNALQIHYKYYKATFKLENNTIDQCDNDIKNILTSANLYTYIFLPFSFLLNRSFEYSNKATIKLSYSLNNPCNIFSPQF